MSDHLWLFGVPLIAALLCFSALWPLSIKWRDVSIVDCLWGAGFAGQMALVLWLVPATGFHGWIAFSLIAVWSARLTWVLLRRRIREGHEDARYQSIRASWGESFWWKSLFIVFLLQGFLQWVIVLGPIAVIAADDADPGVLLWLGAFVAILGLAAESVADQELDRFKQSTTKTGLCTTGLRAHVRHPNYLGEIIFWCGIAMVAMDAGAFLGLLSPVLMIVFLTKVSGAPLVEERLEATRPEYPAYRARVPAFIPRVKFRTERQIR